jgi:hypothetical protein
MEQTPDVKKAVGDGKAVVACVYEGWVPPEISAQLPDGFGAASWAVEIENGRITRLLTGSPESIAPALINGIAPAR